jgi:hypothetical protein
MVLISLIGKVARPMDQVFTQGIQKSLALGSCNLLFCPS